MMGYLALAPLVLAALEVLFAGGTLCLFQGSLAGSGKNVLLPSYIRIDLRNIL